MIFASFFLSSLGFILLLVVMSTDKVNQRHGGPEGARGALAPLPLAGHK
jgi:hypothetical protein